MASEHVEGADGPGVSPIENLAIKVWNLMGGEIDWTAVPWIAEMLGCEDLETLTRLLTVIRNHGKQE